MQDSRFQHVPWYRTAWEGLRISPTRGQPDLAQSFSMLAAALDGGVSSLDTARAYGDAEDVLGAFFREYTGEKPFLTTNAAPI